MGGGGQDGDENPWRLNTGLTGWVDASRRLDAATAGALAAMDIASELRCLPSGAIISLVFRLVLATMGLPENEGFGAGGDGALHELHRRIDAHLARREAELAARLPPATRLRWRWPNDLPPQPDAIAPLVGAPPGATLH
jgi:hypothetical protein